MQRRLKNSLSWVSVYPGTPKTYVTVEREGDIERTLSQFDASMKTTAPGCVVPETITSLSSHTPSPEPLDHRGAIVALPCSPWFFCSSLQLSLVNTAGCTCLTSTCFLYSLSILNFCVDFLYMLICLLQILADW